mgnify:CR=1 FL=1
MPPKPNKPPDLWQIGLPVSASAEEAACELMAEIFQVPPAVCLNTETGRVEIRAYLDAAPGRARLALFTDKVRRFFGASDTDAPALQIRRLRREDWAHSWKRHFRPLHIGKVLLIRASWHRTKPQPGQKTIVLDPGLSFGTGRHPTTRFCLDQLARWPRTAGPSFLDLGTGSGILALAAARLGYAPVVALDNDPEAVRVARENARRNRLADRVAIHQADLTVLPTKRAQPFDLVAANLTPDLLIAERWRILAFLKPAGGLVLAGILAGQFAAVQRAYEAAGWAPHRQRTQNEWRSGLFRRR